MSRNLRRLMFSLSPLMAFAAFAIQTGEFPVGVTAFGDVPTPLIITSNSPEFTTISLDAPEVVIQEHFIDFQSYSSFAMPGEPVIFEEGSPTVPQISRYYRIPNTGGVDLVVTNAEFELMEDVDPMPYLSEGNSFDNVIQDASVYTQDAWYPAEIATASMPMIMRDFRVVMVTLHPVQVNPVTRQARIYHNLTVDLVGNASPSENELLNPGRPTGSWVPLYESVIANLDEDALLDATERPGSYLIIAKSDAQMLPWVDSLATWKKRRGYDVIIDARPNWSNTTMVSRIQELYATSDPKLEFVCLMGDPSAGFGVPTGSGDSYDHPFALGNSSDDLEDIGVGRLTGSNSSEMAIINAKIMAYERTPNMSDTLWYRKAFLYAGVGNNIASNYTLMQWTSMQFQLNTDVDNNTVSWCNPSTDPNLIRTQLEGGVGYFFWRGSWLSQMPNTVANTCNSGTRLPVVMCVTCGANEFVGGLGIAESYLLAGAGPTTLRGGVCAIGTSTSGTHAPPNGTFAGGLLYAITTQLIEHVGHALNAAKVWLPLSFGVGSQEAQSFTRWNNLMGEPSLSMWTRVPTVMTVSHPQQVSVGAHHMALDILESGTNLPIQDALVVLWKGTETYSRELTDATGHVNLPIDIRTSGDLLLTITKRNHVPYLATIPCNPLTQYVSLSSYAIDDDNAGGTSGNSNGIVNPGEIIDLPMYFKNFGTAEQATGISAVMTSHSSQVTVVQGSANYANIAPGDSALPSPSFRVSVAPGFQDDAAALLTVAISSSSGPAVAATELVCVGGRTDWQSHQFTTPFNPGVTSQFRVTVKNNGGLAMNGTTGQLISYSPFVSVDDFQGTFGDIAPGAVVTNTTDQFTLRANTLTFRGHVAPLMLICTSANGLVDTTQFTISVGSATAADPTGPDAYGYYAYDNTDVSYEMHPTFAYVDISQGGMGTNLNLADTGEKNTISNIWSTARSLPFNFTYYGEEFDSITVCANGWAAFGSQAWYDGFRNFPIPAQQAPNAMMAPYWDDLKTSGAGLGVWDYYDAANHRYIIQWKATGAFNSTQLNFELVLYDEDHYPTFDGNGQILFQYQAVTLNMTGEGFEAEGQSIGIQAPFGRVGLPINYQTTHTPGSATVSNNRAILFTTNARMLFGDVRGQVRDAETNQPMPGVTVTIDGQNYNAATNDTGWYFIPDVLIGTYTIRAHQYRFNDATVPDVVVELDSLETVNLSLTHPEFALTDDSVNVTVGQGESDTTSISILNGGNGPLDYSLDITYAGDDNPTPWDLLQNDIINVTGLTGDHIITGVEFVGDYWYATGGGAANRIYRFDLDGDYEGFIPQPGTSDYGWFDMAWDGELLWGSDSHYLVGININTGQTMDSIYSPLNPTRAIAYDPDLDHFWVADYYSDIYEIDRSGNVIRYFQNEGADELAITGLAWRLTDPDGYKLYIFSQNGAGTATRVTRMHPLSLLTEFVVQLEAGAGDRAGGCTITGGWNSTLLVFGAVLQNNTGDRIGIYEVDFNTTWINVGPSAGDVPGAGQQVLSIGLNAAELRPGFTYSVYVNISSDVLDSTYVLPVNLTVEFVSVPEGTTPVVREYALQQNFPNPFNPSTTIGYELKDAGPTKLTIYNIGGQQVATLVDQVQPAGVYSVAFDAARLSSGLYFYRLESGSFTDVKKMVLMK